MTNCVTVPNFVEIAQTTEEYMAIFRFFKMAASAILDFENFKFLTVRAVKRVELHHHAKLRPVSYTHLTLPTIYSV